MPTDVEAERAWQGLRQRGELDTFLFPLRKELHGLRLKLEAFLVKKMLTPKQWGEVQYLQGRIRGIADAILSLDRLSRGEPERQPRHRPDGK